MRERSQPPPRDSWLRRSPPADDVIPLLAVPYMGETGRVRCADAGIAWLDLSGNARILGPGLIVLVEGKPNRYKRPGRPSAVFAPMGSRIARCLLVHPEQPLTQRELARTAGIDEGYVSRIVGRLERDGLITRERNGAVRPGSPDLLLDAWREVYDFTKHRLILGHIPARSGDELLRQLAASLEKANVAHAVTGLAAAWLLDRFAGFRTVTCYLEEEPSDGLLADLSFREDERGANVWLAVPNDPGVFYGAASIEGIRCVHPVQVYLDLFAQHERAVEAAARLRSGHLNWSSSA